MPEDAGVPTYSEVRQYPKIRFAFADNGRWGQEGCQGE